MNPNIDRADHVLNIDDSDSRPGLTTVLASAMFYGLGESQAMGILEQVVRAVDRWREHARNAGISNADVDIMAGAFSSHAEYLSARD